ncbi:flagellar biosynthesis protein FlhB [Fusibacter bizertensis]|uniref:Flagellar biosynthetic protein FlhB n=1 Tax=Fusibacter bizertensis TaxID=1488331 RepID=A0ABT6N871_9FIRM|nr:flagellar biosynthesis protein FlhB [Fusibacter bizertensis]MDH8676614.1 flagellar biosynthesis protein FlhB [Fusibacter bizertensis]
MLRYFDLQLFSEEKTEQPTSKKMQDSREKGQIPQSKDLNGAVSLLAVFMAFSFFSNYYVENLIGYYQFAMNLTVDTASLFSSNGINKFMSETIFFILKMSLPLLLVALVSGLLLSYIQVGFIFTTETIKPKLEKINPLKGLKNMFSTRSLVEMLKSVSKAVLLLYVAISYIAGHMRELLITQELELGPIVLVMWSLIYGVVIRCAILLFVIAVFDFAYKRWKNNKDLMMSKQEIKEEYKQSEGDPQLKSKIKEKQRTLAMSRMMQEVPKADVIITNPTHFAVALKYDASIGDAPLVTAKGQDLIAQNIKRIASENNVPIVENKPLAQTIYKTVDIGSFIPGDLYEAVAEVLAYVYSLKKKN